MSRDDHTSSQNLSETSLFDLPAQSNRKSATRQERVYQWFDRYVYAPAKVGFTDWRMPLGLAIVSVFIVIGTIGFRFVPEPSLNEAAPYTAPFVNMDVPLGTDRMGQGIAKQLVHATPAMLQMAVAGAVFATGVAVIIGIVAGYKGGKVDSVLMTMTDIVMTIPALPLVILLAAVYQPKNPFLVGIILAIDNWPGLARSLRSQVLTIREDSYVEAARAMGISSSTIMERDISPQLMPYILINAASSARAVIFESVALYFLGFLPFSTFNWGVMMNLAYQAGALSNMGRAGHWLLAPMLVLTLFSFGLIILSQGLDRVFNPQLRARHARTLSGDDEADIQNG